MLRGLLRNAATRPHPHRAPRTWPHRRLRSVTHVSGLSVTYVSGCAGVDLGQSASTFLTISNAGTRSTSPLSFDAAGDTGSFTVGGTCIGHSLAPADSCQLRVTFGPQTLGAKALSLTISGSRYATVRATFDGYGKRVVVL